MKRMAVAAVAVLAGALATTVSPAAVAAEGPSADLLAAMQRDLGLDATQAAERLRQESAATVLQRVAEGFAGESYGGAWFDASIGKLVVGVTDEAKTDRLRKLGAEPRTVAHKASDLDAAKAKLDASPAPAEVTGWYVDTRANAVTITVKRGQTQAAQALVEKAGAVAKVVETDEAPRLFKDTRGGDAYYINNAGRCSIGFAVGGGFVTAGHCGSPGDTVTGVDKTAMGEFEKSSFPGNDYAFVKTNSSWTSTAKVNHYGGADVIVSGHTESAVGASICRSGSTTGWHCGEVQAKSQTVNYQEGSVSGLTRTNVCAEPGDSGGSWVSGTQAQGVTSGGSGNCTSGGTTYYQPVNEILETYGLALTTG
ncbi:S1 family peptidase [Lentzea flaviverrucosa]|uniref:Streptogrisin C n=1 Tax=Lentzea flaviverrucosa TaxID=200379 RepID=A0A1H9XAJ3_9PSEU|nr:S1 family peptidase [Lentzea flaviverrucosa]RDI21672.1 streptogrisin C [Lentzea flaviverrucosa]SES43228.1 streptogrisin C [Lentzea flaviverrucosa]